MYSTSKYKLVNKEVTFIEVKQKNIEVTLMDYGATVLNINLPNQDNEMESITMAYNNPTSYLENEMYLNAIVGPTSGRIKNAQFSIDDSPYQVDKNFRGTENLHGGYETFAFKIFDYEILEEESQTEVIFKYRNTEANSRFPGTQNIQIIYTIKDSEITIQFMGDTTEKTLMNLTSHLYFNLSGNLERTVLDNYLQIKASKTIELDDTFVPVTVKPIKGTHLDFRNSTRIKDNFFEGIYDRPEKGIDNPFLLDEVNYEIPNATLFDPISKRKLQVFTTYPSIVCYTHNYPDGKELLFGRTHEPHLGICFETQNPPNGINIEGLEDSVLYEGEDYYHKTTYKFSIEE